MKRFLSLLLLCLAAACTGQNKATEQTLFLDGPTHENYEEGLDFESARRAFSRAALRRHLRFLGEIEPGYLTEFTKSVTEEDAIRAGTVSTDTLVEVGRLLFGHEFRPSEGMQTPIRRINGPDSNTCASCHWKSGLTGAGSLTDNSLVFGTLDRVRSADSINPPSLLGVGIAQMLAKEMTQDLHDQRDILAAKAKKEEREQAVKLTSKGVEFGTLHADQTGALRYTDIDGVDPDLVVKPFRWKGTTQNLQTFVEESFQEHMKIGRAHLTEGQILAMVSFLASSSPPAFGPSQSVKNMNKAFDGGPPEPTDIYADEWSRGQGLFSDIGCAVCHAPKLFLKSSVFETSLGSPPTIVRIDFSKIWNLEYDEKQEAYIVNFFSDLKRHDLGTDNASQHYMAGVQPSVFMTRRLWDLADTAPYMHDGRASWLNHAIRAHGGEAEQARDTYLSLSSTAQADLRVFLMSLRRTPTPLVR